MELYVVGFLCLMLIATQVFWMFHTQGLVNKIMSGNYTDYAQSKAMLKKKDRKPKGTQLPLVPREDLNYMGFGQN